MENGKPSPEEIRKFRSRVWGCGQEQLHANMAAQKRGTLGGQTGLKLLLDIQNQFL